MSSQLSSQRRERVAPSQAGSFSVRASSSSTSRSGHGQHHTSLPIRTSATGATNGYRHTTSITNAGSARNAGGRNEREDDEEIVEDEDGDEEEEEEEEEEEDDDSEDTDEDAGRRSTSTVHNQVTSYYQQQRQQQQQQQQKQRTVPQASRRQESTPTPRSQNSSLNLTTRELEAVRARYLQISNTYGEEAAREWYARAAAEIRMGGLRNQPITAGPSSLAPPPPPSARGIPALPDRPTPTGPSSSARPLHRPRLPPSATIHDHLHPHCFRILELVSGKSREIHVIIHQYPSFSQCPPYTALSWTWGKTKNNVDIYVRNWKRKISVTPNCIEVLKQLEGSCHSRSLWVDIVCINQDDPVEKALQVSMMGHIYRTAEAVVAYIGEEDEVSQRVMRHPSQISQRTVERFLERRYFSRTWVIQEVCFARDLRLRAGGMEIPWDVFTSSCNLPKLPTVRREVFGYREHNLMEIRQWYQEKEQQARIEGRARIHAHVTSMTESPLSIGVLKSSELPAVLRATRKFKTTLERDKIFALVPLFEDLLETDAAVRPDYGATRDAMTQRLRGFLSRRGIAEDELSDRDSDDDGE